MGSPNRSLARKTASGTQQRTRGSAATAIAQARALGLPPRPRKEQFEGDASNGYTESTDGDASIGKSPEERHEGVARRSPKRRAALTGHSMSETRSNESPQPERDASGDGPVAAKPAMKATRREDHQWIREAQAGDEQAFASLVRRYQARALRVARNMLPQDEDARDLVQEAFMRVFRNLSKFNFKNEFGTWLYRIVTNLAIDQLRKRRPSMSTSLLVDDEDGEFDLEDPRDERPSDAIEALETASEVNDCLSALAPHFQSVLMLRELEGMACNDIAEIVGATHVTVRWRLHRGRKLFQDEWERRMRVTDSDPSRSLEAEE
ncbi:MAG: RNA polymerase sigma-70 factor (ECF subfamily) [Planctomycetota bacterium]|jgi:RNA polymerase sigma-70 factor (ECF subfamily)